MSIKVRATELCFIEGHRRREGEEFDISSLKAFNKNAMELVGGGDEPPAGPDTNAGGPSTVPEYKAALDSLGISYPGNANKAALVALYEAALSEGEGSEGEGSEGEGSEGEGSEGEDLT